MLDKLKVLGMSFPEDEDTWWVDLYMLVLVLCALLCGPGAHVNI